MKLILLVDYRYLLHFFTRGGICLTGEVDRHILLQGQDTEFQLTAAFGQSPKGILERTTIIEVIIYQLTVCIEPGHVATIVDVQQSTFTRNFWQVDGIDSRVLEVLV